MTENMRMTSKVDPPHSSRMNAWTPKAAFYKIALPFQAGKSSVFTLRGRRWRGENNGDFVPVGWVQP